MKQILYSNIITNQDSISMKSPHHTPTGIEEGNQDTHAKVAELFQVLEAGETESSGTRPDRSFPDEA
jgi:hypothetical protein